MALPDFVIIGAQKAATTWLHQALRKHPQIFMPPTETLFFEDPHYDDNGLCRLKATFAGPLTPCLRGAKRPNLLGLPDCPRRLAKHIPNAKLIAMLRDPTQRAVSHYFHDVRSGRIPYVDPNQAFEDFLGGRFAYPYLRHHILENGKYGEAVARYREYYPQRNILLLTDLDLKADPQKLYRSVCRFLEVDDGFVPVSMVLPRNQGTYSKNALVVLNAINRQRYRFDNIAGWAAQQNSAGTTLLALLARTLVRGSAIARLIGIDPPALRDEIQCRLLSYYLPDIEKLERESGLDLSRWKTLSMRQLRRDVMRVIQKMW